MPVNIVRFEHQNRAQWGAIRNNLITPIPGEFPTTGALISAG